MRAYEFHFNIKAREDSLCESFVFDPENNRERMLGSLYMAGELVNALPQDSKLLDGVANAIKERYYSLSSKNSEQALTDGLKKANAFLEKIAKDGNVSWLGNFNFAALSIKPSDLQMASKIQYNVHFTKTGNIRVLLVRQKQILDIGKNLELESIEPYPLKIFGNIISGKIAEGDKLLVFTKEAYDYFFKWNLIKEIAKDEIFSEKKLGVLLKAKKVSALHGIFLMIDLIESNGQEKENKKIKPLLFDKEVERISLSKTIKLILRFVMDIIGNTRDYAGKIISGAAKIFLNIISKASLGKKILNRIPKINNIKNSLSSNIKIKKTEIKLPETLKSKPSLKILNLKKLEIRPGEKAKKNLYLIGALALVLLIGFIIIKKQDQGRLRQYDAVLTSATQNIAQATKLAGWGNDSEAYALLKKTLDDILPLTNNANPIHEKALSIQTDAESILRRISKLENIADPKLFYEFDKNEFIPQQVVLYQNSLYFYNIYANELFKLKQNGEKNTIQTSKTFSSAATVDNLIMFLQSPDTLYPFKNDQFGDNFSVKYPYPDFSATAFTAFRSNLYFLDGIKGEIIKYSSPLAANNENPETWLKDNAPKVTNAVSMTVDIYVWVLKRDNTISKYFGGDLQETNEINVFPFPKNFTKIYTLPNLPYIYLMESVQKRVIVLNKSDLRIIKQFQSDKFDNLKDFAVSEDGRKIFIINGTKVFQIIF